jgi:excisionase family DNA binding protein
LSIELTLAKLYAMEKHLLSRTEAADYLGMSLRHFERYVQPHLGMVRTGRLRLVPRRELDRWVTGNTT